MADYICGIELTALKFENCRETSTDRELFDGVKTFKKNYLKKVHSTCCKQLCVAVLGARPNRGFRAPPPERYSICSSSTATGPFAYRNDVSFRKGL